MTRISCSCGNCGKAATAAGRASLNPQPLPPGKAADEEVSARPTGMSRKTVIIVGGKLQEKATRPAIRERVKDYQDQHHD